MFRTALVWICGCFYQVYKGLDIVTNKVTAEEQAECPHHLINYISPLHTQYTVVDYQKAALPIVSFV